MIVSSILFLLTLSILTLGWMMKQILSSSSSKVFTIRVRIWPDSICSSSILSSILLTSSYLSNFDIEVVLLLPLVPIMLWSSSIYASSSAIYFILILLFGLLHEWSQGSLEWVS
uniref:NADH-ubiquinone oxidoreductase chain 3 n=1 Tax=Nautilus pompilius TaxID=34573 RepID=A0A221ZRV9_9MOLL|nr:NADH dehydrogenase subunit 3 [Nautilus pompilius]ASO66663.1 NADH dehydrogenase subunit 3 [Nautilus pompilius]